MSDPYDREIDPYWVRLRIAEHEATHAIAAMQMGLPVLWVTIDQGSDEGIDFMGAVKIPEEEIDRVRDVLAIAVAMAAPSHLLGHGNHMIGRYARVEAGLAYEMAGRLGVSFDEVYDHCVDIVDEQWVEIIALAHRLMDEGKVVFDHAPA